MKEDEVIDVVEGEALPARRANVVDLMPVESGRVARRIEQVKAFVKREMREGVDWGRVRGVPKPFLWKPGAEKLMMLHGCMPVYEIIEQVANPEAEGGPYWEYTVQAGARLISNGEILGTAIGMCSNREAGYWDRYKGESKGDPWAQKNTILKMAQKRALVSLALHVGALSADFTVDEEIVKEIVEGPAASDYDPNAGKDVKELMDVVLETAVQDAPSWGAMARGIEAACSAIAQSTGELPEAVLHQVSEYKGRPLLRDFTQLQDLVTKAQNDPQRSGFKMKKNWERALGMVQSVNPQQGVSKAPDVEADKEDLPF